MSNPGPQFQPGFKPRHRLGTNGDGGEASQFNNIGRNVAVFTAAYLLDLAGMLDDTARRRLDGFDAGINRSWPRVVENIYHFDRAFVQNLYAVLLDSFLPHDAMAFILRGLDVPGPTALLDFVLGLNDA